MPAVGRVAEHHMLKKIIAVKNAGCFVNSTYTGVQECLKTTLVLGGNGFGKTTPASTLRSNATNREHPKRQTFPDNRIEKSREDRGQSAPKIRHALSEDAFGGMSRCHNLCQPRDLRRAPDSVPIDDYSAWMRLGSNGLTG
jgi:hypothetical protein